MPLVTKVYPEFIFRWKKMSKSNRLYRSYEIQYLIE